MSIPTTVQEDDMSNQTSSKFKPEVKLPGASPAALRGKQSIRATFRLTANCINAINIVATQLGIKQKSLFDHLIEDPVILAAIASEQRLHHP